MVPTVTRRWVGACAPPCSSAAQPWGTGYLVAPRLSFPFSKSEIRRFNIGAGHRKIGALQTLKLNPGVDVIITDGKRRFCCSFSNKLGFADLTFKFSLLEISPRFGHMPQGQLQRLDSQVVGSEPKGICVSSEVLITSVTFAPHVLKN